MKSQKLIPAKSSEPPNRKILYSQIIVTIRYYALITHFFPSVSFLLCYKMISLCCRTKSSQCVISQKMTRKQTKKDARAHHFSSRSTVVALTMCSVIHWSLHHDVISSTRWNFFFISSERRVKSIRLKKLGLKRIPILSNPSPNRVVETNTEHLRVPLDKSGPGISLSAGCYHGYRSRNATSVRFIYQVWSM